MGIVPCLVGWFIMDEPCIAVELFGCISVGSVLVDQEVIFSAHILQVALIALLTHKIALAEGYVWHVGAVAVAMLGTAEQIECLADAVESANTLGCFV